MVRPDDNDMDRHSSYADAIAGHEAAVTRYLAQHPEWTAVRCPDGLWDPKLKVVGSGG